MLSDEEKDAIEQLKKVTYSNDYYTIDLHTVFGFTTWNYCFETILNLIEKQQKEIENNQKFKEDVVNSIMLWDEEDLPENDRVIVCLDTIISEFSRLENIEDEKIQVAVEFVEEKRDKYWKDKIREKIKELEKCQKEELQNDDEFGNHSMKWAIADYVIETLKELLGE